MKLSEVPASVASPATGKPLHWNGKYWSSEAPETSTEAPIPGPGRLVGSPQQEAFWGALTGDTTNVLLEARAGTGKSASCREGIWRLIEGESDARITYCAFNRAIADEFQAALPPGAQAATMHSLGYAALRAAIPGIGDPDGRKMWRIVDRFMSRRDDEARAAKGAAVRLAGLCKGLLLDGTDRASLLRLAAGHGIRFGSGHGGKKQDDPIRDAALTMVPKILRECLIREREVDFSDMTWAPVMRGLPFAPRDAVFVDEAQDLDPCQHALVQQVAGGGKMVVVGDPFQAIYAFRGADCDSIATMSGYLRDRSRGLSTLPLTVTRRCPTSHVDLARRLVSDLEAMPDAIDGVLAEGVGLDEQAEPGVMVLCRTNAPLVQACYRLAAAGVPVAIQGKDLGEGLIKLIWSFEEPLCGPMLGALEEYQSDELTRLSGLDGADEEIGALIDRCDCIRAAAAGCRTTTELEAKILQVFRRVGKAEQRDCVLFSSIHRAKGTEADSVVILRPDLLPHPMAKGPEAVQQERNLAYVAATRARRRLAFVGSIPDLFR